MNSGKEDPKKLLQQVRKKLEESEERYRTVFECTGTAMMVVEEDTSVSMWNHKLQEVTGYTEDDAFKGQKWIDFVHEDDLERMKEYHADRRQTPARVPTEYEFRLKHKSGQLRDILMNVSMIPGTKQSLISLIDITERKAAERERLEQANKQIDSLRKQMMEQSSFHNMVSRSRNMKQIFDLLPEMADADATVLVTGESGTGKELVARSLHELSSRTKKPFIAINCSALPDNLLESELFGYKAGAFTDAKKDKPGTFAAAEKGTIFLDEIGDISPAMQVKLLRILQEKTYEPLGTTKSVTADVRIIAATNKDLVKQIGAGEFREDLYYRLNVLSVHVPPLRERRGDIPLLCSHFIARFNNRYKKNIREVSKETLDLLLAREFKGNIRELENIMERACIFCKGRVIKPAHLPPEPGTRAAAAEEAPLLKGINSFEDLERMWLTQVLEETGGNKGEAAKKLGVHRATLFRKMKSLGIE